MLFLVIREITAAQVGRITGGRSSGSTGRSGLTRSEDPCPVASGNNPADLINIASEKLVEAGLEIPVSTWSVGCRSRAADGLIGLPSELRRGVRAPCRPGGKMRS
ncbi:hypothetical protein F7Q99_31985 [Streptomyces kaniharaensis]|uniref:Uncharacterized protein n=1 Tax=Streptomyces kaniharaensis TaxID=212423 RepID=A0A6N7KYC8_9ACTN|nr:hypothetical protein [Streptomyces kaniharaensis]MQS16686.1 hypothetical protein [Streptomyces kaniharaensis]